MPPPRIRRGIRFQLSMLLLMSTLNGIVLASAAVAVFSSLVGGASPNVARVREATEAVSIAQNALLLMALPGADSDALGRHQAAMEGVGRELRDLGPSASAARAQLDVYAREARAWITWVEQARTSGSLEQMPDMESDIAAEVLSGSADGPPPVVGEAATGAQESRDKLLRSLTRAYRTLQGEMALLANQTRPAWVDSALRWAPWFMAWVVGVAIATMVMALQVQSLLSDPLESLQAAASRVAQGELNRQIPALRGAPEVESLARYVEAMRARLVWSIQRMDTRNDELAAILDSLDEAVLVLDRHGVIVELNSRAQEIVADRLSEGRRPSKGVSFRMAFPPLPPEVPLNCIGHTYTFDFATGGSRRRHLSLRVSPMMGAEEDEDRAFVAVLRDVTHDQEVESLKRDFLSVVTHELKTPLTAIEGYTKLLIMGKGGVLTERQRSFATTIATQTLALKEMIQNLLDITRLEGGNLPINPALVDPAQAATQVVDSFKATAQTRGLTLGGEATGLDGAMIQVDPFRLQQVLGNLISNAIKFTPEGGRIDVLARREGAAVTLSVSDTGRGIPPEALPRLFGKFYQVNQGDTRIAGGAGLGLYICRQLVEAQGGRITVTSTVDVGSCFTVEFPVAGAGEAQV